MTPQERKIEKMKKITKTTLNHAKRIIALYEEQEKVKTHKPYYRNPITWRTHRTQQTMQH